MLDAHAYVWQCQDCRSNLSLTQGQPTAEDAQHAHIDGRRFKEQKTRQTRQQDNYASTQIVFC